MSFASNDTANALHFYQMVMKPYNYHIVKMLQLIFMNKIHAKTVKHNLGYRIIGKAIYGFEFGLYSTCINN